MKFTQDYYTAKEAAGILGVHYQSIMNWVRNGKLRAFKAGRVWRISKEALEEFTKGA